MYPLDLLIIKRRQDAYSSYVDDITRGVIRVIQKALIV